jgi:toxin ParE1/3/4
MRVQLSARIEEDLDVIAGFIARHNPTRAITFVDEIRDEFERIGKNPGIYPGRPELGTGIRMSVVGQYPILFRISGEHVSIRRVVHGARDLRKMSF